MTRRIVIEASSSQKETLDLFLQENNTTLTEWFADRVAEATASYAPTRNSAVSGIAGLSALADPQIVFTALNAIDWAFTEEDTSYLSHNLHPYPAKFIPQIPRHLVAQLSMPGELVWDPFGGSGTTALESLLLGRRAISSDVNPVAEVIGVAKTTALSSEDDEHLRKIVGRLELLGRDQGGVMETVLRHSAEIEACIPNIPHIEKWFHQSAVRELAYLRWQIERLSEEHVKALARVAFSKIILKASNQDNETRYASKPREIAVGMVLRMFATELDSVRTRTRATSARLQLRKGQFITADTRRDTVVTPASVDLIVTSPPYPNATDYHLYHRFRLYWLGFAPQEVGKREIGSHLRHQKEASGIDSYVAEMTSALGSMYEGLRPARFAVMVIGDGVFDGTSHSTVDLLSKAARGVGFETVGVINRAVHSTKRSFISPARRLKTEQLLVLRRPPKLESFELEPPPYKLWPYEQQLRLLEITRLTGVRPQVENGGNLSITLVGTEADKLRRLTFTHAFAAKTYAREKSWQGVLENGDAVKSSTRKDPKYATHGLHAYKGKFYPQLAKSLINIGQFAPGARILDPFCGSGTVLLEAKLNGVVSWGIDLNPLAVKITRAKVQAISIDPVLLDRLLNDLLSVIQRDGKFVDPGSVFPEDCLGELQSWFPEAVLGKLAFVTTAVSEVPNSAVRELLEICLSNIVRLVSHQDPKDLRIRRRKESISDAPVFELFSKQVEIQRTRLRHFAERAERSPSPLALAEAIHGDCREKSTFDEFGLRPFSIDGVVTSPPYATALPYIDTDRLSLLLLLGMRTRERARIEYALTGSREISTIDRNRLEASIDADDMGNITSETAVTTVKTILRLNRNSKAGFRRKNQAALLFRYYDDMTRVLTNLNRVVRPGGSLFFVIGDNTTEAGGREVIIRSARMLRESGSSLGWRLRDTIPITVTQDARPHNRNSITENDIVWFER